MGDEELNFTEEEARCWAGDPRNQAHEGAEFVRPLAVGLLLVITILLIIWLLSSPAVQHEAAMQPALGAMLLVP